MKRHAFTIVELLVIITVIAIVAGMLFPNITAAERDADETERMRIKALEVAIKSYESTYNVLPFTNPASVGDVLLDDTNYDILIKCLNGDNTAGGGGANPRKIRFLEVDADGSYTDAWGNKLMVALDLDYDGNITDDKFYWFDNTRNDLPRTIAIWSKGFDGEHSPTDTHATNHDNLNAWELKK